MEQSIIIAGFGGQGVLSAGIILANAFMLEDKHVTWYPCYGAEMRGGAVNCEIVVSEKEVTSVHKKEADFLIALNDLSFNKFLPKVKKNGIVIANSSLINEQYPRNDVKYIFSEITDTARELGNLKAANMAALGILCGICTPADIGGIKKAIDTVLGSSKPELKELNHRVLSAGYEFIKKYESEKQ